MSFHQRIKKRRTALFPSQEAFARELEMNHNLKVSWQSVQQWEKEGGTAPNRGRMPAVVAALKTTAEWLLHGTGPEVVDDDGASQQNATPERPAPPKWMDAEAYELLELYFSLNERQRTQAMLIIRTAHSGSATAAAGGKK